MTEFFRRHSLVLTSIILLICSFQLMSISVANRAFPRTGGRLVKAVLTPIETTHHELTETVRQSWNDYIALQGVAVERNELAQRVKALEAQNSRLAELESENERLRGLLSFTDSTGLTGIAATIIGRDSSNWIRSITIDRGSDHGLRPGLPVVDGRGIVGQTTVVTANSSKVLLLTDSGSAVASLIQGNRAQGIAEGALGKKLALRYVLKEYKVQVGDRVVASGLDGVFPKGTLVGVITQIPPESPGLFHSIEMESSVDFNRLETVLVVTSGK